MQIAELRAREIVPFFYFLLDVLSRFHRLLPITEPDLRLSSGELCTLSFSGHSNHRRGRFFGFGIAWRGHSVHWHDGNEVTTVASDDNGLIPEADPIKDVPKLLPGLSCVESSHQASIVHNTAILHIVKSIQNVHNRRCKAMHLEWGVLNVPFWFC